MAGFSAPLDLLKCVVSPEWSAAVAGISTLPLEGALARPDLWQELQLLEKLLYKNSNQHSGAQHFQRLQEVRRLLALLKGMQLARQVAAFHSAFRAAKQRGTLPTGSVLMAYGGDQRHVPSHNAAAALLRTLRSACHLVEQLAPAVHRASLQLLAQLAHSFFMPLCLTSLAALARIQVLTGQLLLDVVKAYNVLAEVAALLPASPADTASTPTAVADANGNTQVPSAAAAPATFDPQLPEQPLAQMLRAQWLAGLPQLEAVQCPEGESLAAQAAATCARYAVHVVQPEAEPEALGAALASAASQQQVRRRRAGKQAAPVLAVMEDRGVPISREDFAAAAAAVQGAGINRLAEDAATEAEAEAAGAAAAEPAAVPGAVLLGVVEDSVAEEDPSGVVASLMEGEARGHLYRRAASGIGLGLGQAKRKQRKPGAPPAAAVPSAPKALKAGTVGRRDAARTAPQQADEGQRQPAVAALSAAPAAALPPAATAATSAATSATTHAPKPAFLSVEAAAKPAATVAVQTAIQPAFLSVAVPARPRTAVAAVSSAAAVASKPAQKNEQPAGSTGTASITAQGTQQEAAAPAARTVSVAAGVGRKRKKPATAAAAAGEPQQGNAVAGAAAPKSWEEWLVPLGGTANAGEAANSPAGLPQRLQAKQQGKRRRGK